MHLMWDHLAVTYALPSVQVYSLQTPHLQFCFTLQAFVHPFKQLEAVPFLAHVLSPGEMREQHKLI